MSGMYPGPHASGCSANHDWYMPCDCGAASRPLDKSEGRPIVEPPAQWRPSDEWPRPTSEDPDVPGKEQERRWAERREKIYQRLPQWRPSDGD